MRRVAWGLLLLFAFTIPWEYSLDFGAPLGNVSRIAGAAALFAFIPAVLQAGRVRRPGALHGLALALYLWTCCTCLWSIDATASLERLRTYAQVMMIVALVWELAEGQEDLRDLLRAYVGGAWVLALLTLADFVSSADAGQIRFVAAGQDPNDAARFLNLGFPFAALLPYWEERGWARTLALGYFPIGLLAVMLTASRSGALVAAIAIAGCGLRFLRFHRVRLLKALMALPPLAFALWLTVPGATIARIATIPQQLTSGDLNQRLNIWAFGWRAFAGAPFAGWGAGAFVEAAHLARIDTAHNTALSLGVEGGLVAVGLGCGILLSSVVSWARTQGPVRLALGTALMVWTVSSAVATVETNRSTWFVLAVVAVAGRIASESPAVSKVSDCRTERGWRMADPGSHA
ncbi:O-antigen ligase family protein [Acidobacteria bacterium AB60]|nr:O-antigen ligase family protein [Acidobacteria bacterium AB60]